MCSDTRTCRSTPFIPAFSILAWSPQSDQYMNLSEETKIQWILFFWEYTKCICCPWKMLLGTKTTICKNILSGSFSHHLYGPISIVGWGLHRGRHQHNNISNSSISHGVKLCHAHVCVLKHSFFHISPPESIVLLRKCMGYVIQRAELVFISIYFMVLSHGKCVRGSVKSTNCKYIVIYCSKRVRWCHFCFMLWCWHFFDHWDMAVHRIPQLCFGHNLNLCTLHLKKLHVHKLYNIGKDEPYSLFFKNFMRQSIKAGHSHYKKKKSTVHTF